MEEEEEEEEAQVYASSLIEKVPRPYTKPTTAK